MTENNRRELWPIWMHNEHSALEIFVEREVIEPGRTLSAEAMEDLYDQLIVFIGTRLARRWDQTGEPPTALRVVIEVSAS